MAGQSVPLTILFCDFPGFPDLGPYCLQNVKTHDIDKKIPTILR